MNILIYRMFFHGPFVEALRQSEKDITFFSSERRMDETGVINSYYESGFEANVSAELACDIITRCRFLSGINFFEARLKVRKMWAAVEHYFDTHKVDLVLSPAVDNYVTDVWFKIASRRGIPAFQPRRSPLPALVRITNSVDNPELRDPEEKEIEAALAHLRRNFKADYQNTTVRNTRQIAKRGIRELAKKIYFKYWKVKYSDPDSFHYNAIFPNKNAITIKSPSQLWFCKRFKGTTADIVKAREGFKRIIFWPLAMAPESALCYLNKDPTFSDYRDVIGRIVDSIPKDTLLVIKEHPSAIGYRDVGHYSKLLNNKNVLVCDPAVATGKIINLVDAVLVNTSSTTGLEAVAVGKPVLALGSCHYKVPGVVAEIDCLDGVASWAEMIRVVPLTETEVKLVVRRYLSNTIPSATWALAGVREEWYQERVHETLFKCIELVNSGYVPRYHGH